VKYIAKLLRERIVVVDMLLNNHHRHGLNSRDEERHEREDGGRIEESDSIVKIIHTI
jgi:hypothetical protein